MAKVNDDYATAIKEYRQALKLEDDAHTHKLLGITLADAGYFSEAITELRSAELGGEKDDLIAYRLAELLNRTNKTAESIQECKRFLKTETCKQIDDRCESVRQILDKANEQK